MESLSVKKMCQPDILVNHAAGRHVESVIFIAEWPSTGDEMAILVPCCAIRSPSFIHLPEGAKQ
jgi:hypothetical protein